MNRNRPDLILDKADRNYCTKENLKCCNYALNKVPQ